jgi:hypothetical protein
MTWFQRRRQLQQRQVGRQGHSKPKLAPYYIGAERHPISHVPPRLSNQYDIYVFTSSFGKHIDPLQTRGAMRGRILCPGMPHPTLVLTHLLMLCTVILCPCTIEILGSGKTVVSAPSQHATPTAHHCVGAQG